MSRVQTGWARPPVIRALRRLPVAFLWSLAAMYGFARLSDEIVGEGDRVAIDSTAVNFFQHNPDPLLTHLMRLVSWLVSPTGLAITVTAAVVLLYLARRPRQLVGLLICATGGGSLVWIAKRLLLRPRPLPIYPGSSFPSGHAFCAMAIYGMLACWLAYGRPRGQRLAIYLVTAVLVALVGLSRIVLGAHYPTDVLAGYLLGSAWLWVCVALARKPKPREGTAEQTVTPCAASDG